MTRYLVIAPLDGAGNLHDEQNAARFISNLHDNEFYILRCADQGDGNRKMRLDKDSMIFISKYYDQEFFQQLTPSIYISKERENFSLLLNMIAPKEVHVFGVKPMGIEILYAVKKMLPTSILKLYWNEEMEMQNLSAIYKKIRAEYVRIFLSYTDEIIKN